MKIDKYGRVSITDQEAFEALYSGKLTSLESVIIDGALEKFNSARQTNADKIPNLNLPENL